MKNYLASQYKKNSSLKLNHSYLVEQFSDYSKIFKEIEKVVKKLTLEDTLVLMWEVASMASALSFLLIKFFQLSSLFLLRPIHATEKKKVF